jgi:CO dehydrogenase nickel-insertion accessory protein CooC1
VALTRVNRIKHGERKVGLSYDIEVEVSGTEHQGKTTLVAYLSKILQEAGAVVVVQRADPQIDEKLASAPESLRVKLSGKTIFIREVEAVGY